MDLMLGTAQLGRNYGIANTSGKIVDEDATSLMVFAHESGIRWLDSGNDYGDCESRLGHISKTTGKQFSVVSKMYVADGQKTSFVSLIDEIKNIAERIYPNILDSVLVHNPNNLIESHDSVMMDALMYAKSEKYINRIGVSVGCPSQVYDILSKHKIDIVQIPASILNQQFDKTGTISYLKQSCVEVHARSIFMQGLVFLDRDKIDNYFHDLLPTLDRIKNTAALHNISVCKMSIEYIKSLCVDKIIVGVDSTNHLKQIVSDYDSESVNNIGFGCLGIDDDRFISPGRWPVGGWKS